MGAGFNNGAIESIHPISSGGCAATGDLDDCGEFVLGVAGVDAFGALATEEICVEPQP